MGHPQSLLSEAQYWTRSDKVLPSEATAETKMQFMKETPAMMWAGSKELNCVSWLISHALDSEYDMNSAICSPEPDTHVRLSQDGKLEVKGYAYGAQGQ